MLPEMKLLADESVDFGIITGLRQNGFEVISVLEDFSGLTDTEVLKIATDYKCLLITEDKDFGELTFRLKLKHYGILLIRLSDLSRQYRVETAIRTIQSHFDKLNNNFTVLNKKGLRIKKSHLIK
jgi:predicted nuclease of predicted toxin-antitoxin system